MVLDPNRPFSRGRMVPALSCAVLAAMVLSTAAAVPLPVAETTVAAARATLAVPPSGAAVGAPAAGSPSPAGGVPACVEGIRGTFSGTFSEGSFGTELNGTHNGDFAVQQRLGDGQQLCARVHGAVRFDDRDGSIRELPRGSWVLVETRAGRKSQRMLVTEERGQPRYEVWLNGDAVVTDAAAQAWLGDALAAVEGFRQIGAIQGEVGRLQGEIGSIQGEVGRLQGEIGSIQGEEGRLQGRLGSIQGEQGSLQGAIGGHQGAIGGLQGRRWQADAAEQARIDRDIGTHEAAIRKLEAEMDARGFSARIAAAEQEIRAFVDNEARGRIATLERRITEVRAEARIHRLEGQIEDLHADDRIREIERRMKPVVERLKQRAHALGG